MNKYHDSYDDSRQHRQSDKLAQHAIMRPRCCSRQVTMTIMMHAVVAFRVNDLWTFVKVQRRQHQHRQEYCQ